MADLTNVVTENGAAADEKLNTSAENDTNSDQTDAKGIRGFFGGNTSTPNPTSGCLSVGKESEFYSMSHKRRGKAVIFNNKFFDPHTKLNERRGTEADASNLYQTLRTLDFDVTVHNDLSATEMLNRVDAYGKENYEDSDCFMCCILTHGDMGILYGRDGKFPTDLMFAPFRGDKCPTLAGKPKIFILQACQGDKLDRGVTVLSSKDEADSASQTYKIPIHADFLIAYSTVPGYYSWRNTAQGSWFIQAITNVFNQKSRSLDLLSMLTMVNLKVAYDFESCVPTDPDMDHKKQVPCITSMLTRKVMFVPKM